MLKATIKTVLLLLSGIALLLVSGCSDPKAQRGETLENANELRSEGLYQEAIDLLTPLSKANPDDPEINKLIGFTYEASGDFSKAAQFLTKAHLSTPDDAELTYRTYLVSESAHSEDDAYRLLELMAERNPLTMNPSLWKRLGKLRNKNGESQAALNAYLKSIDPETDKVPPETASAIAAIFWTLKNPTQAEHWYRITTEQDEPDALGALFGLLEIKLSENDIPAIETIVKELDERFPGALDASEASSTRSKISSWYADKAAAEKERQETAAEATKEAEAAKELAVTSIENTETIQEDAKPETDKNDARNRGKSELADELAQIEAFANSPAIETETNEAEDLSARIVIAQTEKTIDELISDANQAVFKQDNKEAISIFWQILGRANTRADIWNQLSRTYLIDGQLESAETTALESTRLSPEEIQYTLDYLRIAQRSKQPLDFLAELETAYDRFPRSPEVALSLARGYEQIAANAIAASSLYRRFIALAPNHPLRSEAEAAINRLR